MIRAFVKTSGFSGISNTICCNRHLTSVRINVIWKNYKLALFGLLLYFFLSVKNTVSHRYKRTIPMRSYNYITQF